MNAQHPSPITQSELEAAARLILRDQAIQVAPGEWWSYMPEQGVVLYPAFLLNEWSFDRSFGAICHEIAEATYSGPAAATIVPAFCAQAEARGVRSASAELLFNALNDLRVNQRYLDRFPGSRRYLAAVYRAVDDASSAPIERKRDVDRASGQRRVLPHHRFLDLLTALWATEALGIERAPSPADKASRAAEACWPSLHSAILRADIAAFAHVLLGTVLPRYRSLLAESLEAMARPDDDDSTEDAEPEPPTDDEIEPDDDAALPDREPSSFAEDDVVEAWIHLVDADQPTAASETIDAPNESGERVEETQSEERSLDRAPVTASRWNGGVLQRFRRVRRKRDVTDYETFDYLAAVQRLQPLIDTLLHGTTERKGLIAILNERRFGTTDPWRRPRRHRRGDSGELDLDHPENLVVDPSIAFLRGQRQRREDAQKDFANVILLDVSGSIVQTGYHSRKFDQLVDTAVVFCEVHERLKLPYQLAAFSETPTVLRGFDECRYATIHVDPASAYVVKDFSHLIRSIYHLAHGETREAVALEPAIADATKQRGLKTVLIVTDGISSDRPALRALFQSLEERNAAVPRGEGLIILAFGLGLAGSEFVASYETVLDGSPLHCARGHLVPDVDALPEIVCEVVASRIRDG